MSQKRYRQFELHADGGFRIVCWLLDDRRLSIGRRLTLKGDDREWYVWARWETALAEPPEKKWQVGGLS